MRAKIGRHRHDFRMVSVGDDALTRRKSAHPRARFQHRAGIAIAECQRLIELVEHGLKRRREPVRPHLVEYLFDALGLLARLADEPRPTKIDQHPFRARRDQRARAADQHFAVRRRRTRHLRHLRLAGLEGLENLFHKLNQIIPGSDFLFSRKIYSIESCVLVR